MYHTRVFCEMHFFCEYSVSLNAFAGFRQYDSSGKRILVEIFQELCYEKIFEFDHQHYFS